MSHTRTRLMAAAAVLAVAGALAAGCGDKETPAAQNASDSTPGAAGGGNGAPAASSPTPTTHKSHKRHHGAHKKAHHKRTPRHHASAHPGKRHRRPEPHHTTTHPRHTAAPKPKPSANSGGAGTATERKVVKLVNAARAKAGCQALHVDRRLRKAAYLHSRDMGLHDYFDHNSQNGRTPWDRIKAQGYRWPSAENIAAGQRGPASVMDAWMHSSGHRANILNCDSKAIGVGVWKGSGGPVWTQDFGFK